MRTNREFLVALKKQDYDVVIVAPSTTSTEEAIENGYSYVPITIEPHGTNLIQELRLLIQFIRIYRFIKPDLVMSHTIKPDVYSGIACRFLNIPYLAVINGIGDAIYNHGILSKIVLKLLKISLKKCKWVFFQNRRNRDFFISEHIVTATNSSVVPGSGVNLDKHPYEKYPSDSDIIIITYIGRISKDKGINELLEAFVLLKKKYQNIQLRMIGTCAYGFEEKIRNAEMKNAIKYLGTVSSDEIHKYIKESHAVILPSYHEGIPNVLLEAGAAGRPIITTFAEGCEDTFDDGVSGIGFAPKSSEAIEIAVEKFLKMSFSEKEKMGFEANKKITNEFDRKFVIEHYMKVIKAL